MFTTLPSRRPALRPVRAVAACLIVAAVGLLSACRLSITNQAEGRSEWKKEYSLEANGTLEVRNTNGVVDVDATDSPTVSVTAERIAHAATDEEAKKTAEAIEIKETVSSGSILLDARLNNSGMILGGGREVKFHIRAPKGTRVTISNTNGNINVHDLAGDLRLDTTNGRIEGRNLGATTRAQTTNGEIALDYASIGTGGVTAETTNGRVEVALPTNAKARINARVTNGGIDAENLSLESKDQSRRRLTGDMNGGGPEIRIETTNGGVSLRGKS